jgi:hypothetical protein
MKEVTIRFLGDIRALSRPENAEIGSGLPSVVTAALMFVGTDRTNAGGGGKWN